MATFEGMITVAEAARRLNRVARDTTSKRPGTMEWE